VLVETGQSGRAGSWQVNLSGDQIELSPTANPEVANREFKALVLGNVYIPEPVLIALAAIEEYAPEWILDDAQFRSKVVDPTLGSEEAKTNVLKKTIEEDRRHWDNWHNLEHYRRAYLALCSEMSHGLTAKA
jgi:hypothetical protein